MINVLDSIDNQTFTESGEKITRISKSLFSDLYKIHLESGLILPVSANTISEYVLFKNKLLKESLIEKLKKRSANDRLNEYAIRSLQRKSYTVLDLKRYLKKKIITANIEINKSDVDSDIDNIIEYLKSKNLLNDFEYATTFVESRIQARKPYSVREISNKLLSKGVSKQIIDSIMENFTQFDNHNMEIIAKKKYKNILAREPDPLKAKNKLYRYLLSKGYRLEISIEELIKICEV